MDTEQLLCPPLLSNEILKQILEERCIEVPGDIQFSNKDKLIDIYNRIAMPSPQRKYNNKRLLEKRLNHLRLSRKLTNYDKSEHLSNNTIKYLERNHEKVENIKNDLNSSSVVEHTINNNDNSQPLIEKTRLSNSTEKIFNIEEQSDKQKRKSNMPLKTDSKKRQKITWP